MSLCGEHMAGWGGEWWWWRELIETGIHVPISGTLAPCSHLKKMSTSKVGLHCVTKLGLISQFHRRKVDGIRHSWFSTQQPFSSLIFCLQCLCFDWESSCPYCKSEKGDPILTLKNKSLFFFFFNGDWSRWNCKNFKSFKIPWSSPSGVNSCDYGNRQMIWVCLL